MTNSLNSVVLKVAYEMYVTRLLYNKRENGTENGMHRDFPGGPVVKTLPSSAGGGDLIPGWGAKMPHALQTRDQNTIHIKKIFKKLNV